MSRDDAGWIETRPGLLAPLPWRFTRYALLTDRPRVMLAREALLFHANQHPPVTERMRRWTEALDPACGDYRVAATVAARSLGLMHARELLPTEPLATRLDPALVGELVRHAPDVADALATAARGLAAALTASAMDDDVRALLAELPGVNPGWRWLALGLVTRWQVALHAGLWETALPTPEEEVARLDEAERPASSVFAVGARMPKGAGQEKAPLRIIEAWWARKVLERLPSDIAKARHQRLRRELGDGHPARLTAGPHAGCDCKSWVTGAVHAAQRLLDHTP